MKLTADDLAAIKARADAATGGPWEVTANGVILGPPSSKHALAQWVVQLTDLIGDENAEFIAHARTDVPRLVAELLKARAALAEKDAEIERLRSAGMCGEESPSLMNAPTSRCVLRYGHGGWHEGWHDSPVGGDLPMRWLRGGDPR